MSAPLGLGVQGWRELAGTERVFALEMMLCNPGFVIKVLSQPAASTSREPPLLSLPKGS